MKSPFDLTPVENPKEGEEYLLFYVNLMTLDYVEAMHKMLQHNTPDDFVIGTGKTYSVKDFMKLAFECFNLDYEKYLNIDENLYRPADIETLVSDCSKAKKELGWKNKTSFPKLVELMIKSDYEYFKKNKI